MFGISYKFYHSNGQKQTDKMKTFERLKTEDWSSRCFQLNGFNFLCKMGFEFNQLYRKFQENQNENQKFRAYLELRKEDLSL